MARASHAAGSGLTPAPLPYSTGAAGSQRRSSDADASSVAHAGTELRDAESRSPTPPQPDDVQEKIAERADHGIWFPEGGTKAWLTVAGECGICSSAIIAAEPDQCAFDVQARGLAASSRA